MSYVKGLYRHVTSGKVYNVIGMGRRVETPHRRVLIYEELHDKNKYDIDVPKGEIWVREVDDELPLIKLNQNIKEGEAKN